MLVAKRSYYIVLLQWVRNPLFVLTCAVLSCAPWDGKFSRLQSRTKMSTLKISETNIELELVKWEKIRESQTDERRTISIINCPFLIEEIKLAGVGIYIYM